MLSFYCPFFQVVTTFELPGCKDMWTVVGAPERSKTADSSEPTHSFLILSRAESTMILQTGNEINELDQSGFLTQVPTIYTGNIGENKFIIQVKLRVRDKLRYLKYRPGEIALNFYASRGMQW